MKPIQNISINDLEALQIVDWGYTTESIPTTLPQYETWLINGHQGPLTYMGDHRKSLREDIKNFFPEFKSALVFLFDYTSSAKKNQFDKDYKFAAYTKGFDGIDYHYWIKEKLDSLAQKLHLENYKLSIDAQPVLERDLAYRSGLGWFGKNSMLINQKHGSFFLISAILLDKDLELETKTLDTDHCGSCTKCIDACPTDAIIDNKIIDANKCISTITIELFKAADAPKGYPTDRGEIFGCDICQEVCPWNQKPLTNSEMGESAQFEQLFEEIDLTEISNREFKRVFKGTSLERTGRVGLLKNL